MKELKKWLHAHPLKAVGFSVMFTFIASAMGFMEQLFWPGVAAYACGIFLFGLVMWLDSKVALILLLVLVFSLHGLTWEPAPKEPKPENLGAGCAIAVVVIVIGGVAVYKTGRFCQRKFPKKSTNAPPASMMGGDYGASWDYGSAGSCDCSEELPTSDAVSAWPAEATTFTLDINVDAGPVRVKVSAGGESQTFAEYQAEVAEQGLYISLQGGGGQHFARDGVPCEPELVPITFDENTRTVSHHTGGVMRLVVLEHSTDLLEWSEFLRTEISDGSGFQVVDTTQTGQMFYRVTLQQPEN